MHQCSWPGHDKKISSRLQRMIYIDLCNVRKGQAGASLIEALIAILILSFGLLGVIGLQTAAVKYQQNSWARSAVSSLSSDIAERIRSNLSATPADYALNRTYVQARSDADAGTVFNPVVDCALSTANCTPLQTAAYDLAVWRRALNLQIPQSAGFISGGPATYVVTISWFDRSWTQTNGDLESSPTCAPAMVGAEFRSCCPTNLTAPAGVRCINTQVLP